MHTWLTEDFIPFLYYVHIWKKRFFKGIDIIQIFLLPDRWKKLQPTEIFLCQKNLFHTDNGATHYLLETTAPNTSTFAVGL